MRTEKQTRTKTQSLDNKKEGNKVGEEEVDKQEGDDKQVEKEETEQCAEEEE